MDHKTASHDVKERFRKNYRLNLKGEITPFFTILLGHKGGDLIDGSAQDVRKIKLSVLILAKGTDLSIGVLE